jgi:benzoate-CoA ligase family protein
MFRTASDLGVPRSFNVATHFIDRNVVEGRGGRVAIECGDERVTYDRLLERVNRVATGLRALGVSPEERVMLLLLDTPAFAYAFFGAIKAGAVAVPVNTMLKEQDYRYLISDSGAVALIVSEALLPLVRQIPRDHLRRLRHIIVDGDPSPGADLTLQQLLAAGNAVAEAEPTTCDDAAFWLYSSGSTGTPKGCVHLHHDMVVCAELFGRGVLGIQTDDRCFSVAKLFFAYGLGNALYFPLAVGATSILWPGAPAAQHVYSVIERYRPSVFYSVPTGYAMLLAHSREPEFDLSSVRLAVSAGEALPTTLFDRFAQRYGLEIIDGIGSTEALHMFISNRPGALRPGSSGQVVAGYAARILDDSGAEVATGDIGNLWVAGDSICASYWNQHEKTRDTIHGAWLRTGDKYTRDADGFYWYAGRSDDMLKVGGQWVSPVEVENVVLSHPLVQECGVVGCEDADGLVKPVAFVVLRSGAEASAALGADIEHHVRVRLAEFKRPRRVTFLGELPKTATGKIQRFKLRELATLSRDAR